MHWQQDKCQSNASKYASTNAITAEFGRLPASHKAWGLVVIYWLRLENETGKKHLNEAYLICLWQKEIILIGYKVCNTCYVQMGLEMCSWIHRTTIIGIFIRCLLKDLAIKTVKLYLAFWPNQLCVVSVEMQTFDEIRGQFINDVQKYTQPVQTFDSNHLLKFILDLQCPPEAIPLCCKFAYNMCTKREGCLGWSYMCLLNEMYVFLYNWQTFSDILNLHQGR